MYTDSLRQHRRLTSSQFRYVSNQLLSRKTNNVSSGNYSTLVAAIVESGFVTWVGLLLYGVASIAPTGHITVNPHNHRVFFHDLTDIVSQTRLNVGFVMECIIPIFFVSYSHDKIEA